VHGIEAGEPLSYDEIVRRVFSADAPAEAD